VSAKFDGMPRSAIDTGIADIVASAQELPAKLLEFVAHAAYVHEKGETREEKKLSALQKIFVLLRSQTGHDFSFYKKNTVVRRVERRMNVHQIDTVEQYVRYLQGNSLEVDFLFKELLIGVTNFFRDSDAFQVISEKIVPQLLQGKAKGAPLRIWVPGCSTGEEAYSVAIVVVEAIERLKRRGEYAVQIFATDIDKEAVEKARQGTYPANIAADVSEERLQRFFTKEDSSFRIRKEIREMVVFAPQDIIIDPPFTKLDLICCRNLLIYFNAELQKKLIPLFHYTLNRDGVLFLGASETIGSFGDLFLALDSKWKIFQRRETLASLAAMVELPSVLLAPVAEKGRVAAKAPKEIQSIPEATQKLLLEGFSPPAVLVNSAGDIIYISGRTGKYLELSTGKAALNIFALARQGLGIELASAVRKALTLKEEVIRQGAQVKVNGGHHLVDLVVQPIQEPEFMRGLLLVIFREVPAVKQAGKGKRAANVARDPIVDEMQKEIIHLRESLQTTTEEMETSQEELKSANEELQSTNEELQSSNEELTTSKEELQSLNEELITVNSELQMKIEELTQSNNDMRNLLNSTEIATIFLDNELNVKRFTTQANRIFNLIQSDVGRPLTHIVSNLRYESMAKDVKEVLESLVYKEVQVQGTDDRWYSMRIMPYRTVDNVIDGAVLTLVDISTLKQLELELRQMSDICESSGEAIIGRTLDGVIFSWNKGAERMYGYTAEEAKGKPIDLIVPADRSDEMADILNQVKRGIHIEARETVRQRKDGSLARVSLTVSPIRNVSGKITGASTIAREIRNGKT
jgi:two-component system CheB/CheR fusion protein